MAWGENDGPQNGPGVLVHPAQPADLAAIGQAQLLDGVHLPNRVRPLRPWRHRRRLASRWGRRLSDACHPALHGACVGQVLEFGLEAVELEEEIGGAPIGVLRVQEEGLLDGPRRGGQGAGAVGASQGVGALQADKLTEVSDRAGAQLQGAGDDGRWATALVEVEDPLSL